MTAPKEGDRVRVEYEAVYRRGPSKDGSHIVEVRIGTEDDYWAGVPGDATLTVLAPPVKVGDVVTADNIDTLPNGSIIAIPRAIGLVSQKHHSTGEWFVLGGGSLPTRPERWTDPPVVLRVGGGES
jgi:hypothetical protein